MKRIDKFGDIERVRVLALTLPVLRVILTCLELEAPWWRCLPQRLYSALRRGDVPSLAVQALLTTMLNPDHVETLRRTCPASLDGGLNFNHVAVQSKLTFANASSRVTLYGCDSGRVSFEKVWQYDRFARGRAQRSLLTGLGYNPEMLACSETPSFEDEGVQFHTLVRVQQWLGNAPLVLVRFFNEELKPDTPMVQSLS